MHRCVHRPLSRRFCRGLIASTPTDPWQGWPCHHTHRDAATAPSLPFPAPRSPCPASNGVCGVGEPSTATTCAARVVQGGERRRRLGAQSGCASKPPRHTTLILCVRCMLSRIVQLPAYHAKRSRIMQTAGWAPLFPQPNRCLTGAAGPCPSPGRAAGWTTRCGRRLCAFCDLLQETPLERVRPTRLG